MSKFMIAVVLCTLALIGTSRSVALDDAYFHGEAQELGHEIQLFIDSYAYADRWDVVGRVNEPSKHPENPVLMADQPWEEQVGLPNVIYDSEDKIFRMWYALYDSFAWGAWGGFKARLKGESAWKRYPYMISYAESQDGVHWTKPLFDKVPYGGHDKTNIVMTGLNRAQEFHVMWTPKHMGEWGRFMLWYRDRLPEHGYCINLAFSDDGVNWKHYEDNPVYTRALDAEHFPVYDQRRKLWLLYARPQALAANEVLYTGENVRTRISVTVSKDLKTWSTARHILVPDELDDGFFFDRMEVAKYGNQYLGFVAVQPRDGPGHGYIELVSSPDGFRWFRSPVRKPFIARGREGDWDGGHTWMLPSIIPVGDWLYMYYVGSSRSWRYRYPENFKGIGMARIRRDRFMGQYAGNKGGWLLSREVKVTGDRLVINIAPEHRAFSRDQHGHVKVELFDRSSGPYNDNRPIEGFGQDDCDRIRSNAVDYVVTWNGSADLSVLKGKDVYIRFYLKNAHLFGFRFVDE